VLDVPDYDGLRYAYQPGDLSLTRIARTMPPVLADQGYFDSWDAAAGAPGVLPATVGVVLYDTTTTVRAAQEHLLPGLAAAGHPVDPDNVVRVSVADVTSSTAGIQNAVLRFRANGVTHVILLELGGGLMLQFPPAASQQGYRPRYSLQSYNGTEFWVSSGQLGPRELTGAVGFGWVPLLDVSFARNRADGPYSNAARQRCVALAREVGAYEENANGERVVVRTCDQLAFLVAALRAGGPAISRDAVLAGVHALGDGYESPHTFATGFGPGDHDGPEVYRRLQFLDDCACLDYTSAPTRLPR
jgi:hypothetical protein